MSQIQNAGLGEFRLRDLNDEINKLIGSLENPTPLNSIAIANMKKVSKDVVASASAAARGTAAHAQKAMLNIKPSELISVNPLGRMSDE